MPDFNVFQRPDGNAEQLFSHREQARQHAGNRKIGPQFFLRELIAVLAQFFGIVTDVPSVQVIGPELGAGEVPQLVQLPLGLRPRAAGQIVEKGQDPVRRFGHFGGQRQAGVILKVEQAGQFVPQGQNPFHDRPVVPLSGVWALIGGAGAGSVV